MKTLTFISFLSAKDKQHRLNMMSDLAMALTQASEGQLTEDRLCLDWMGEGDLGINLRNVFFKIDGQDVREWLKQFTDFQGEGDGWQQIKNLKIS